MSIEKQISLDIPSKKISQLDLGVADLDSVIPASDSNGLNTKKVKLRNVVGLPHQHNAQDVSLDYDGYTTVRQALEHLLYKEPIVQISNNVGIVQYGSIVNNVVINWTLVQGQITQQSITDIGNIGSLLRTYTYSNANITTGKTFTLQYSDGLTTKNISTSIEFSHKRYWGLSTLESLTDQQVRLLNSEFSASKNQTRIFSPNQQYIYFAFPAYLGDANFKFNGLPNSAWEVTSRNFVNSSNYSEPYRIYRSTFLQSGSNINLEVF
jgi:hypothetical protein